MKNEFGSEKWVEKFATGVAVGVFALIGVVGIAIVSAIVWGVITLIKYFPL